MEIQDHYIIDKEYGSILEICEPAKPFSSDALKTCPLCRGTFRNLCRYGRIVKRAALDEGGKRFAVWSKREHASLERKALEAEDILSTFDAKCCKRLQLANSRKKQIETIKNIDSLSLRKALKASFDIRQDIVDFQKQIRQEEQPYHKLNTMVANIRRKDGFMAEQIPDAVPVARPDLSVTSLLLRFELAILSAVVEAKRKGAKNAFYSRVFTVDFNENRKDCLQLVEGAKKAKYPREEVEGLLLFGKYCALERSVPIVTTDIVLKTMGSPGARIGRSRRN